MTSKDAVVVNVIQSHVVAETEDDDVAATEE